MTPNNPQYLKQFEVWFVTGSQHLYGEETLKQVAEHSTAIAKALYNSAVLESIAKMAYLTEKIDRDAPRLKAALIKKHYDRKHGGESYYGQE